MNISLVHNDAVSSIVKIVVEKKDYEPQVEKQLRQYRQKANIPGFRKGMVPLGMVRHLYGKHVLTEEVNKCLSENLYKYIHNNDINILGEPLPNETKQKPIDFDTQEDFEFYYDIALSPRIDIALDQHDELTYYKINADDTTVQKQIDSYCKNYGSYDEAEDIEAPDLVSGVLSELDENNTPKEDGIVMADAELMPEYFKNDDERAKFIGAKKNDVIIFNPDKACNGSAADLALLLKTDKENATEIKSDFSFEVQKITRYRQAELGRELFDKILGDNVVKTEEEFREKVKLSLTEQMKLESEYKFLIDLRAFLIKKAENVTFADNILKRWLLTNKENTPEKLDKNFPKLIDNLKFTIAKNQIIRENDLKVADADIENAAKEITKIQFIRYGMLFLPDHVVEEYAKDLLKQEDMVEEITERALQDKLVDWIKNQIKIETKEITHEEFVKLPA
ncbi:MAG: trigger factor [Tannerella sp.]|jgi:trigger factor|nr:trigger factor [Tannerella sp.]